ncbi:hypothetical protein GCM10009779_44230 [Polymorphospora rubra]
MTWDRGMTSHASQPAAGALAPVVYAVDLCKTFGRQGSAVAALDHVSVAFAAGRFTSIMGPSGSVSMAIEIAP